jgi:1-deoxy-D-xylulose-5-phosphate reductoisomerase
MMFKPQTVAVLGATGSIGQNTLNVIAQHPERFTVFALSGHSNMVQLAADIIRFKPRCAVVPDAASYRQLLELLPDQKCSVLIGEQALVEIASAPEVDTVMAAIVGAAGLKSSLAAAHAGKKLLLANKESMVVAGALLMDAVATSQAVLLPIDSEHNAIFQCLPADQSQIGVESILLTASGGPFRNTPMAQMFDVTPEQAIAHPTWSMGRKISVDSASLMNKGLELIEACWLFNVSPEKIEVVVHPQSVIHSMVRYVDGSVLAQMGSPDMRTPISYGLAYPDRMTSGSEPLAFSQLLQLNFDRPDRARFPCLRLAEEAMAEGGTVPAVLNAANEMSVAAFLNLEIGFMDIPRINEQVMTRLGRGAVESIDQLLEVDRAARAQAAVQIQALR